MIQKDKSVILKIKEESNDDLFLFLKKYLTVVLNIQDVVLDVYDVYKKYYLNKPELQKVIDKFFKRVYVCDDETCNSLSMAIGEIALNTHIEEKKEKKLKNSIGITLSVLLILVCRFSNYEIISDLLSLFYENKKVILWGKEYNNEIGIVVIYLDIISYNKSIDNLIDSINSTKIFSKRDKGALKYYSKKYNGKILSEFNPTNTNYRKNFNELKSNLLATRKPKNKKITSENCFWCSPLETPNRSLIRCERCEAVYDNLKEINNCSHRYKRANEISQHIIRQLKNPKNKKNLLELVIQEYNIISKKRLNELKNKNNITLKDLREGPETICFLEKMYPEYKKL